MKQGRLWNYLSTVGESFERFTFKLTNCVEEGMPGADPDRSPSSSLDEFKKQFMGQLGVALMYFCYSKKWQWIIKIAS